ncbi:hypothetical protein ANOM_004817, partial [Aspergillus nomiae NRRL 13137]
MRGIYILKVILGGFTRDKETTKGASIDLQIEMVAGSRPTLCTLTQLRWDIYHATVAKSARLSADRCGFRGFRG